jgi:hypothetical protein
MREILVGKAQKKRDHLGHLGLDGRIILKRILNKQGVTV